MKTAMKTAWNQNGKCEGLYPTGPRKGERCWHPAKLLEDGKWYCRYHAPSLSRRGYTRQYYGKD